MRAVTELVGRFDHRAAMATFSNDNRNALTRHIHQAQELAESSDVSDPAGRSEQFRDLAVALDNDRARLMVASAGLAQEEQALRHEIRTLRKYDALMKALAVLMQGAASAVAMNDLLLSVRQRHIDLVSQLTVAERAHASLHESRQQNVALIQALRSATTSMLSGRQNAENQIKADRPGPPQTRAR